jgi:hypothetical protein
MVGVKVEDMEYISITISDLQQLGRPEVTAVILMVIHPNCKHNLIHDTVSKVVEFEVFIK